jgi:hypothetical protein
MRLDDFIDYVYKSVAQVWTPDDDDNLLRYVDNLWVDDRDVSQKFFVML